MTLCAINCLKVISKEENIPMGAKHVRAYFTKGYILVGHLPPFQKENKAQHLEAGSYRKHLQS
ncbi:hypothetical protein EOD39_18538 [Acipenser ruthenus]|uniref:Uncharacterized protein n=1 Tax=Acipenser ruthenus TaxID=7906 RepID=A0A444U464_ACIRT|nr:hypothetical protein EOD39_18538 [Acipenser ruthenus]